MAYAYKVNTKHRHFPMPYLLRLWILLFTLFFFFGYVEATNSSSTDAPDVEAEQREGKEEAEAGGGCTKPLTIEGSDSSPDRRFVHLNPASLSPPNGSSVTFHVRADCPGRLHVMLHTFSRIYDVTIEVTSNSTVLPRWSMQPCFDGHCPFSTGSSSQNCSSNNSSGELGRFRVSWKDDVTASMEVNGAMTRLAEDIDTWGLRGLQGLRVYGVFLAYEPFDDENGDDSDTDNGSTSANAVSYWEIDVLCEDTEGIVAAADYSSMVTHGHLAGAVIAALLCGILFGALCVHFGRRVIAYLLRQRDEKNKNRKDEEAALDNEELHALVGADNNTPSSSPAPDQPSTKPTAAAVADPSSRKLAHHPELPGDTFASTPTSRRKAPPNAYTQHDLKSASPPGTNSSTTSTTRTQPPARRGSPAAAADVTTAQGGSGGGGGPRKGSGGSAGGPRKGSGGGAGGPRKDSGGGGGGGGGPAKGRIFKSPLPALPGDDVNDDGRKPQISKKKDQGAAAGSGGDGGRGKESKEAAANSTQPDDKAEKEEEEFYINAETNVYEGLKHESPIYENRDIGDYESLRPGQPPGKSPAAPPSKKSKRK